MKNKQVFGFKPVKKLTAQICKQRAAHLSGLLEKGKLKGADEKKARVYMSWYKCKAKYVAKARKAA